MKHRQRIMLIDGHALAFRAFYALAEQGLRTSSGIPTYAIFGFASIMLNAIKEHQPTHIAVSFDIGRTFRDDLYAEYKAGRSETPAEFHPQLEHIKQMMTAFNIPIYVASGFEADDVLGTLARQASQLDTDTLILTGDSDTLQLVDERVHVLLANPFGQRMTSIEYDEAKVSERYEGLKPNQLADLRGLKGDSSDNIPGVKGIGEKGAITLLNLFGTIENMYAHFDEIPNRYKKILDGQLDAALFSKKLATIVTDAPVQLILEDCDISGYDKQEVIRFFQQFEIGKTLISRLPQSTVVPADLPAHAELPNQRSNSANMQLDMFGTVTAQSSTHAPLTLKQGYVTIVEVHQLVNAVESCIRAGEFAFDTETTGTSVFTDELIGISLACSQNVAWYIPIKHANATLIQRDVIRTHLAPLFEDPAIKKYAHNAKFDIEALLQLPITVRGLAFDTMLVASLLDKRRGLKDLAFYELQLSEEPMNIDALIGKGKQQTTLDTVDITAVTNYAASDADYTYQLTKRLSHALSQQQSTADLFYNLELPLIDVLITMEQNGIMIDVPYLHDLSMRTSQRLAILESEIYAIADVHFNIASGDQLSDILFGKIGLPTAGLEKTKTGRWSLNAEALERLREHDSTQIIERILQHRQLSKLKSTYIDSLPLLVNQRTKRIHTSYNQLGAATGRLSSVDPNLQNIPTRTEEGREVRRAFVAAPGYTLVAADYSQIELRVLAHITQDPNLMRAFHEDQDIHAATAAQLFGIPVSHVDKHQRRLAKTTVFGVIYGISAFGLSQRTNVSRSEAQALIDGLFTQFPGIRTYIDSTITHAKSYGFVTSLFGRKRMTPDIHNKGPRQQAAEREAINHPIQATAADIMKLAMLRVHDALAKFGNETKLLLQVHDELIVETPEVYQADIASLLRHEMTNAYKDLTVPLKVDVEAGQRWDDLHEV